MTGSSSNQVKVATRMSASLLLVEHGRSLGDGGTSETSCLCRTCLMGLAYGGEMSEKHSRQRSLMTDRKLANESLADWMLCKNDSA